MHLACISSCPRGCFAECFPPFFPWGYRIAVGMFSPINDYHVAKRDCLTRLWEDQLFPTQGWVPGFSDLNFNINFKKVDTPHWFTLIPNVGSKYGGLCSEAPELGIVNLKSNIVKAYSVTFLEKVTSLKHSSLLFLK